MDTRRCASTSTETVPARVSTSLRAGRPRAAAFPWRPVFFGPVGRASRTPQGAGRPRAHRRRGGPQRAENPVSPRRPPCGASRTARGCPRRVRAGPGRAEPRRGTRIMARTRRRRPLRAGSPTAVVTTGAPWAATPPARAAPAGTGGPTASRRRPRGENRPSARGAPAPPAARPCHPPRRWRERWSRGQCTAGCPAGGPVRRTPSGTCHRSCDRRPKAALRSSRTWHVLCKDIGGSS